MKSLTLRHHGQLRQPWLCLWTPLVRQAKIPDTMKARNMTEEQVKRDVLLAAQPTKQFVTAEQGRYIGALSTHRRGAHRSPGANLSIDGGWTAGERPGERCHAERRHAEKSNTR